MQRLNGRTALITGASRGIGRAIAVRFASEGANVAINYTSSADAANEVAETAVAHGVEARTYQANVGIEADCVRLANEVMRDFGQVDALINNAGVGSAAIDRPTVVDATNEQWEQLMAINLWGPIWLCRALVPHMRKAHRSDVIVLSSIAVQQLVRNSGVYAVSKAGLEAMAHTLAREEKRNGMRVNIIAPGLVDTEMGRTILSIMSGTQNIRDADEKSPFGFVCTPDDIAATALHLCSEDGRYITNQRVTVSGD